MPLTIESHFCEKVLILECTGQIVIGAEAKILESALEMAKREFRHLVLDMANVTRLDSIGLGLLVRAVEKLRKSGGDLRIAEPPEFVTQLLKMTRLTGHLQTSPTEDEAIAALLGEMHDERTPEEPGHRVLLIDRSPDLSAFIRAVLTQHGYQVRSASLISDAKMLLRFHGTDYILFGPDTPASAVEAGTNALRALAPRAAALALTADFATDDAHLAADALLALFGTSATPAQGRP